MRRRAVALLLLLALVPASADPDVATLVANLGADDWKTREDATSALIDAGDAALPALREALGSGDAEVRMRATSAIDAIECGLSSKGYARFGNVREAWKDLNRDQRREMLGRLQQGLNPGERARTFAKLALDENDDDDTRTLLIEYALQADGAKAMAIFGERIEKLDPKKDASFVVKVASWYNSNGQSAKAVEVLDKVNGPMDLPMNLAREVAGVYGANRNWKRAADAFGKLAEHAPAIDEAEAAGERIAYLKLGDDEKEFQAALELAARANPESRDVAFGGALAKLRAEGMAQGALAVVARGAEAGCSGEFAVRAGQLLLSMGRETEALLMFRKALKGVDVDAAVEGYLEEIREACTAAGVQVIATREFAAELKDPSKAAAAHAAAARLLSDAGQSGAAAVEWRRAAALCPGSPIAAAEAARALTAAGDPRASRWALSVRAMAGDGSPEAALAALPATGAPARLVVRRAVEAEFVGSPSFHAVVGDIAATADANRREVIGFTPGGRVAWRWRWAEGPRQIEGRFTRTRSWDFTDLLAAPDAFVLVVREADVVTSNFESDSGWAGSWIVVIDAETGTTRSMARAEGGVCDPSRASVVHGGRLFVANEELSVVIATDLATARTAWIRPVRRSKARTDPARLEILPRLAARGGLVFVPSPHGASVLALRAADGSTAWETPTPGPAADVVLDGETVWACAADSVLQLDAATGRILQQAKAGATVVGAPARLGDVLAVRTRDGWLRGFSAGSPATEKWKVFVGAAAGLETLVATDAAFFLCRRDRNDVLPSWVVSPSGEALRRLYLRFTFPPENWRGTLLIDDLFGRRQAFCLPAGGDDFSPLFPSGLLRIDGAAIASGDAAKIAALAEGKTPEVAAALAAAALAIDPESPEALTLRLKLSPPADPAADPGVAGSLRADAWRALDAFPPLDPRRAETLKVVEAAVKFEIPLALRFDSGSGAWVDEMRLFNALLRLAKTPGDRDAMAAVGDSGLRGAASFLPADTEALAAIARLRCGEPSSLPRVIEELRAPAGLARMEAAEALAWCPVKEAADALRPFLGEGEPVRVRLSAALATGAADPAALDVLEKFGLPSDNDAVFLRSASILLAAGRPRALDALGNPENSRRSAGTWDSPFEMMAFAEGTAGPDRLEALISPKGTTGLMAARALMQRDRPRAMKAMAAALEKCDAKGDNERWLLQLISTSELPSAAPLCAARAKAHLAADDDLSWPALYHMLAESLDACGKGEEARKYLDTYGSILPDTAETNNNTAWFLSIAKSPQMSDGPAALPRAMRAVAAEPWNSGYWDTLAEAFRASGLYGEAVHAATFAMQIAPVDGELYSEPYYEKQLAKMRALASRWSVVGGR